MTKQAQAIALAPSSARNKEFVGLGGNEVRTKVLASRDVSLVKMGIADADAMAAKYAGHVWKADRWVALGVEFRAHLASLGGKAAKAAAPAKALTKAQILAQLAALTAQLDAAA